MSSDALCDARSNEKRHPTSIIGLTNFISGRFSIFKPKKRHVSKGNHVQKPESRKSIDSTKSTKIHDQGALERHRWKSAQAATHGISSLLAPTIHSLRFNDHLMCNDGLIRYNLRGPARFDTIDSGIFSICDEENIDTFNDALLRVLCFDLNNNLNESSLFDKNKDDVPLVQIPCDKTEPRRINLGYEAALRRKGTKLDTIDPEYDVNFLLDSVSESKMVSCVFEVKDKGLSDLFKSFDDELLIWIAGDGAKTSGQVKSVAVCCELFWSVPVRFRDHALEVKLKDTLGRYLRYNNRVVWNKIDSISAKRGKLAIFPDSTVLEKCVSNNVCFVGSYRRHYDGFLPAEYRGRDVGDTIKQCRRKSRLDKTPWTMIGCESDTTILMLNLICLSFDKL